MQKSHRIHVLWHIYLTWMVDFHDKCIGKLLYGYIGVSKNRWFSPKMDGENNGKPY